MIGIILLIVGYLLGSIPFAIVVSRARGVDIRKIGTHNPGAANVYREVGKSYGILVWFLDTVKGIIPMVIANIFNQPILVIASVGSAAIVGHCFSIFLKFRGGKGVATMGGVVVYLFPPLFPVGALLYFLVQKMGRKFYIMLLGFLSFFVIAYALYKNDLITLHKNFVLESKGWEIAFSIMIFLAVAVVSNISTIKELKREWTKYG